MKRKRSQFYFFIILVVLFTQISLYSQSGESSTRVGISASYRSEQIDILIPIKFSDMLVAPIIGIVSISDVGSDFHFGLVERFYFNSSNTRPYLGLLQLVEIYIPDGGDAVTDFAFGISLGGEHFFDDSFSVGISGQLNFTISDEESIRFGTPGKVNFNTASALFASIYF